jgi:hypothetical protein
MTSNRVTLTVMQNSTEAAVASTSDPSTLIPVILRDFDKDVRHNPDLEASAAGWIASFRLKGKFENADQVAQAALKSWPRSVRILNEQGQLYLDQKRRADATKVFEKALAIEPKNEDALKGLSKAGTKRIRFKRWLLSWPLIRTQNYVYVIYLSVWLVVLAVLMLFLSEFFGKNNPAATWLLARMPAIAGGGITGLIILGSGVWTLVVFMSWIILGGGNLSFSGYQDIFKPYRPIWVGFILIVLCIFLIADLSFSSVEGRVAALRGTASLLRDTIVAGEVTDNPSSWKSVETWINKGANISSNLKDSFQNASSFEAAIFPPSTISESKIITLEVNLRLLPVYALQSQLFTDRAARLTKQIIADESKAVEAGVVAKGTTFGSLSLIATEMMSTTGKIVSSTDELLAAVKDAKNGSRSAQQMDNLTSKAGALTSYYYQTQALVEGAKNALSAGNPGTMALFAILTTLYAVFLLFPWVLTFQFLLRKRENLVNQKIEMLQDLGLEDAKLSLDSKKDLAASIGDKAFKNSEYVVSLILLTVITSVLWFFFFYPYATAGMAHLISQSGGVKALTGSLVSDATPITFGFLGAYFFLTQMFLRRYLAADLNPKVYIYAIVRVLTTFILSLALQIMCNLLGLDSNVANLLAFIVGIFPQVGVNWILQTLNKTVIYFKAPEYIDHYPLIEMDGLNVWHEVRLLEEKIENVQNLATASLRDLVIHTNFSAAQLIDWIDQALLYIHVHDRWPDAFRSVGIRTATDLLRAAGQQQSSDSTAVPSSELSVTTLAAAINAAQATSMVPDPKQPGDVARLAAAELYRLVADIARTAEDTDYLSQTLVADKPETLDTVIDLQQKLHNLAEAIKNADQRPTRDAADKLSPPNDDRVTQAKEAVQQVVKSSEALSMKADAAKTVSERLQRKQPDTLGQLPEVKVGIESICTAASDLKSQIDFAAKCIQPGQSGNTNQAEWKILGDALEKLRVGADQILKDAQSVREGAKPLNKDKPETLNKVVALQKQLNALNAASGDIQIKVKETIECAQGVQASSALLAEILQTLQATAESVKGLMSATMGAKDDASVLDIDKPDTLVGMANVQSSAKKIWILASEVKTRGQAGANALQIATAPTPITLEILKTIITALQTGPNIDSLQKFWSVQKLRSGWRG